MDKKFKIKESQLQVFAYVLLLPAFFLVFSLVYNPFDIQGFYTFGKHTTGYHLVLLSCIILGVLLITRNIFALLQKKAAVNWTHYILWCFGEVVLVSAFLSLYTMLFKGIKGEYFSVFATCGKFVSLSLCYPYGFIICLKVIRLKDEELEKRDKEDDQSLVKFYDEHKRLKMSIAPSSILYVQSEFNYVKIYYLDAGKVKEFLLRASMKSLEAVENRRCLMRCQRSYFVNPEHVTVLRKDKEGFIFAEMNIPGVPPVPVSKPYFEALSAAL